MVETVSILNIKKFDKKMFFSIVFDVWCLIWCLKFGQNSIANNKIQVEMFVSLHLMFQYASSYINMIFLIYVGLINNEMSFNSVADIPDYEQNIYVCVNYLSSQSFWQQPEINIFHIMQYFKKNFICDSSKPTQEYLSLSCTNN